MFVARAVPKAVRQSRRGGMSSPLPDHAVPTGLCRPRGSSPATKMPSLPGLEDSPFTRDQQSAESRALSTDKGRRLIGALLAARKASTDQLINLAA